MDTAPPPNSNQLRPKTPLLVLLNSLGLLLAISILITAIISVSQHHFDCVADNSILQVQQIVVGVLLLIVSLAAIVGASYRIQIFIWIHITGLLLLLALLVRFTILTGGQNINCPLVRKGCCTLGESSVRLRQPIEKVYASEIPHSSAPKYELGDGNQLANCQGNMECHAACSCVNQAASCEAFLAPNSTSDIHALEHERARSSNHRWNTHDFAAQAAADVEDQLHVQGDSRQAERILFLALILLLLCYAIWGCCCKCRVNSNREDTFFDTSE